MSSAPSCISRKRGVDAWASSWVASLPLISGFEISSMTRLAKGSAPSCSSSWSLFRAERASTCSQKGSDGWVDAVLVTPALFVLCGCCTGSSEKNFKEQVWAVYIVKELHASFYYRNLTSRARVRVKNCLRQHTW